MDAMDIVVQHLVQTLSRIGLIAQVVEAERYDPISHQPLGRLCPTCDELAELGCETECGLWISAKHVHCPQSPQCTRAPVIVAKPGCHLEGAGPGRLGLRVR